MAISMTPVGLTPASANLADAILRQIEEASQAHSPCSISWRRCTRTSVLTLRAAMIFAATIVLPNPVAAASTPVSCSSSAVTAVSCSFVNVPRKRASMPYPASVHLASASPHSGHPPTPRCAADNRVVRRCGGKAIQRMRQFVESRTSKAASYIPHPRGALFARHD